MNSSTILEIYRITLLSNVSVNQWVDDGVLEVYRITLLSNCIQQMTLLICVLEVYRITLLSNRNSVNGLAKMVLEVYRMTLRSNVCSPLVERKGGFRGLQNYTTLKLRTCFYIRKCCFRGL